MLQFNVSRTVALLPIVLYTAGFCLGPLIAAPLSEVYGRRIIYWTNLPMLVIFNAIAAASNNIVVFILFKFLAGVGGSGWCTGCWRWYISLLPLQRFRADTLPGTISDLWEPRSAGRVGLTYILAPFLCPSLGPLWAHISSHNTTTIGNIRSGSSFSSAYLLVLRCSS